MTAYHEFVRLLYQACFASEAVDHFNLVKSEDSAHLSAWHWLLKEQYTSSLTLIEYVRSHADPIIATMGKPPTNVPDQPPPKLLRSADLIEARFAFLTTTHWRLSEPPANWMARYYSDDNRD